MNPDKFTRKTNEALGAGLEIAQENGHAQYTPIHLAIALIEDPTGLLRQAISSATGGDSAVEAVNPVLRQYLKKLQSQDPALDNNPPSTSLIKCIRRAQSYQKEKGDKHLIVDHLILGLLDDAQIVECFNDAGVSIARVKSEVENLGERIKRLRLHLGVWFCLGVDLARKWFVQARCGDLGKIQVFWMEMGIWNAVKSNMLRWPHRPHATVDERLYRVDVNERKHEIMLYDTDVDEWRSLIPLRHGLRRRIHKLIGIDNNVWGITNDFNVGLVHMGTTENCSTPRFVSCVGPIEGTDRLISYHVLIR